MRVLVWPSRGWRRWSQQLFLSLPHLQAANYCIAFLAICISAALQSGTSWSEVQTMHLLLRAWEAYLVCCLMHAVPPSHQQLIYLQAMCQ